MLSMTTFPGIFQSPATFSGFSCMPCKNILHPPRDKGYIPAPEAEPSPFVYRPDPDIQRISLDPVPFRILALYLKYQRPAVG